MVMANRSACIAWVHAVAVLVLLNRDHRGLGPAPHSRDGPRVRVGFQHVDAVETGQTERAGLACERGDDGLAVASARVREQRRVVGHGLQVPVMRRPYA